MKVVEGNVWALAQPGLDAVVIPTNIGWRRNGNAVMGRGLALQTAYRYPTLERTYGDACKKWRSSMVVSHGEFKARRGKLMTLIAFPTKPINSQKPWLSWENEASIDLIKKGLTELLAIGRIVMGTIYLPLLGCGEGHLDKDEVEGIMKGVLVKDFYTLVKLKL